MRYRILVEDVRDNDWQPPQWHGLVYERNTKFHRNEKLVWVCEMDTAIDALKFCSNYVGERMAADCMRG